MKGFEPFASWDETYVHHKHNPKDRTVLEVRTTGDVKEPWTWVRTHGKGRVFYTAWGHDHRTWSHPGFHNLVERGTRWACGQDPALAGTVRRPAEDDGVRDGREAVRVRAGEAAVLPGRRAVGHDPRADQARCRSRCRRRSR